MDERCRVALVALLVLGALGAAPAQAHDSEAPPGAPHTWLPKEDWVRYRWLPFDERRLQRLLAVEGRRVRVWLANDHRTLGGLARRRGEPSLQRLASRLVAPWRGRVTPARYSLLRSRSLRVLTQGHLAQHMLFHLFHHQSIRRAAPAIFGAPPGDYRRLRYKGLTPYQIGARYGRTRRQVFTAALRRFAADARRAIRGRESPRDQARRMLVRQRERLAWWLDRGLPKLGKPDPDGPNSEPAARDPDQEVVPEGRAAAAPLGGDRLYCPLAP